VGSQRLTALAMARPTRYRYSGFYELPPGKFQNSECLDCPTTASFQISYNSSIILPLEMTMIKDHAYKSFF
jgi:hypothetical protein